ncbi:hypothetical protein ElyMa_003909000 [Elysia marginata]|uniref:Uncharacterized protein n=1 Tax=Elysia marginata TaxID=1093978 RepID=A0AAV4FQ06_9GAST|nr:hypothetical protein ElyMa_003909000 [Elysia marginata]
MWVVVARGAQVRCRGVTRLTGLSARYVHLARPLFCFQGAQHTHSIFHAVPDSSSSQSLQGFHSLPPNLPLLTSFPLPVHHALSSGIRFVPVCFEMAPSKHERELADQKGVTRPPSIGLGC